MKTFIKKISILLVLLISGISSGQTLKAFKGAYGGGAYATGGRAGDTYVVTNNSRSASTPGSLLYGIQNRPAAGRKISFSIGVSIDQLESHDVITNGNITIAGHSAPSDSGGVKIYNGTYEWRASNSIIRYVTFALGDYGYRDASGSVVEPGECCVSPPDGFGVVNAHNVIIDHVSVRFGLDENASTAGTTSNQGTNIGSGNVTWQYCLIAQALASSIHTDGRHPMGSLINLTDTTQVVSYGRNYYAYNEQRNPRLSRTKAEIINNVYFGSRDALVSGQGCTLTVIGNSWKPASYGAFWNNYVLSETNSAGWGDNYGKVYFDDNYLFGFGFGLIDPTYSEVIVGTKEETGSYTDWPILTYQQAIDSVIPNAGNKWPSHDAYDAQWILDYDNDTGTIIDSQAQLGGFLSVAEGTQWTDSDNDGMNDALENTVFGGLSQTANGTAPDGRSNWEYLYNSLVDGDTPASFFHGSLSSNTTEGGGVATFSLALGRQPSSDVVITAVSSDTSEGTVNGPFIFTTANWATPQTVTVTGVDDGDADGDILYTITLSIDDINSDDDFDGLADKQVAIVNLDDESGTVAVIDVDILETDISIAVGGTYQLTLDFDPANPSDESGVWSSSNPSVATVNTSGLVTGISNGGPVTITFTATDTTNGTQSGTCSVTVNDSPPGRKLTTRS